MNKNIDEIKLKQKSDFPLSFWQYMPHQQDAIKRFTQKCKDNDKHGILLIHSMGSGKTLTSLGMALNLNNPKLNGKRKWVIITPPGLDSAFRGDMNDIGFSDEDIDKMEIPEQYSSIKLTTIQDELNDLREKLSSLEEGTEWDKLQELTKNISNESKLNEQEMKNLVKFVELTQKKDEYEKKIKDLELEEEKEEKNLDELDEYPELKFYNFDQIKLFNESGLEAFYDSLKDATVICDEAHNLVNILKTFVRQDKKLNYTRILDSFDAAFKVILLSGTPLQQEWSDLTMLTSICAGYVNKQKHAKFPTYDKKINIMYPPPVTHDNWVRKRLLDPNINAFGTVAGIGALTYAIGSVACAITVGPGLFAGGIIAGSINTVSTLAGIGTAFSATAGAVKGVLSLNEGITASQVGEVNVFNMEKLINDLQNYISFFDYTQLKYHLTPSFPMPPYDPENKIYKKIMYSNFQTDLYLKQSRIEDIIDNLDLEFVGRKSSGSDAFKLEESRLINLSNEELTNRLRVVGNLSEDNHFFNTAREFRWNGSEGKEKVKYIKNNLTKINILDFNKVYYAFPRYNYVKMIKNNKNKVNITNFTNDKNNDNYLNDVSDPLFTGIDGWLKNKNYLDYMKKYRDFLNLLNDSYKSKSEISKDAIVVKNVKRTELRDQLVSKEWEIVQRKVPIKESEYNEMKKIFKEKEIPSQKLIGEFYYRNKKTGETVNSIPESLKNNIHDKMEKSIHVKAGKRFNLLLHVKKGNKIKITFDSENYMGKTQDIAFNLFDIHYNKYLVSNDSLDDLVEEYYNPKWKHVQMGSIPYIHQSIDGCNLDDAKKDNYKCKNVDMSVAIKDFRNKRTKVLMKYKDNKYKKYQDYIGPLSHIDNGIYNDNGTIKSILGGIPAYCDVAEYLNQQDATYDDKCYQPKTDMYWGTNLRYKSQTTKEFIPTKDGTILISFDNHYSYKTSKNIKYVIEGDYSFVKGDMVSLKKDDWAQFYEGEIIKVNRDLIGEDTYDIKFKGPINKVFNKYRSYNPLKTLQKFEEIKNIKSISPKVGKIFLCNKFIYAFTEIMKYRETNHYLPVFYSNFEEYGFKTFSAMLTSMGYYHIVIHPDDPPLVRKKLIEYANLPYRKFVPCGKNDNEKKNSVRMMKYRPMTYEEEEIDNKGIVKRLNLNRYKNLSLKNRIFKKEYNLDLDDDSLVPVCIVLHPKIVEGLSFNLSPMILVNEPIKGYGRAEQLYARIIRAIRGDKVYDFNNKEKSIINSTVEGVIKKIASVTKKDVKKKVNFLKAYKIDNNSTLKYVKVYMDLIKKQKELINSLERCKNEDNTCKSIDSLKINGFFNENNDNGFFKINTAQAAGNLVENVEMLKYFNIDKDFDISKYLKEEIGDTNINNLKQKVLETVKKEIPSLVKTNTEFDFNWTKFVKDIPNEYKNLILGYNSIKNEDKILNLKVKQNNNFQYHIFLIKQIKLLQVVGYILKILIFNHNFIYNIEKLNLSTVFSFINDKDEGTSAISHDKYFTSYKILKKIVKSEEFKKIPLITLLSEIENINKKFTKVEEKAPKSITECISEGKLPFMNKNLDNIEKARYFMSAEENKPWWYPDYTVVPNVLFKMNVDVKKYIENYKKKNKNEEIKFEFQNGKIGHINSKDLLNCENKEIGDLCRASAYLVDRDIEGNSIKTHRRCSKQVIILQNSFNQIQLAPASFIRGLGKVLNNPSMMKATAIEQPMPICMDLISYYTPKFINEKKINSLEESIMNDLDKEKASYTGQYLARLFKDNSYPSWWGGVSPTEATNNLSSQLSPDEIVETSNRIIMFNWQKLVEEIQKNDDLQLMSSECAENEKEKCKIWLQEKIGDIPFLEKTPGNCVNENNELDDVRNNQYKILAYSEKVNESWANHYSKLLTLKNQILQSQSNIDYLQAQMLGIVGVNSRKVLNLLVNNKNSNGSYQIKLEDDIDILKIFKSNKEIYKSTKTTTCSIGDKQTQIKNRPGDEVEYVCKEKDNNTFYNESSYQQQYEFYKKKYPYLEFVEKSGIKFKKGDLLQVINFNPESDFTYSKLGLGSDFGEILVNSLSDLTDKLKGSRREFKLPNKKTPPKGYGSHWLAVHLISRKDKNINDIPVWQQYSIIPAKKENRKYFRPVNGPLKNGKYEIDEQYDLRNELLDRFNNMNKEYESKYENNLEVIIVPPVRKSLTGNLDSMINTVKSIGGYIKHTTIDKWISGEDKSDMVGEGSLADNMETFYKELAKEIKLEHEENKNKKIDLQKGGYKYKYITHPITGNSYHLNSAQGMLILNKYKNIMNRK